MNYKRGYTIRDGRNEGVVAKTKRGKHISRGLASYHLHHTGSTNHAMSVVGEYKDTKKKDSSVSDSFLSRWFGSQE